MYETCQSSVPLAAASMSGAKVRHCASTSAFPPYHLAFVSASKYAALLSERRLLSQAEPNQKVRTLAGVDVEGVCATDEDAIQATLF